MSIPRLPIAVVACLAMALAGCSSGSTSKGDDAKSSSEVTLTNCGNKVTYPKVAQRLYVNDGNIIAMALSAGAARQIAAVSSLGMTKRFLLPSTARMSSTTCMRLSRGIRRWNRSSPTSPMSLSRAGIMGSPKRAI